MGPSLPSARLANAARARARGRPRGGGRLRPATPRRTGARFSVTRRRHAPSASLASRCPESLVYDPRPREGVDFLRSTGCPEAFVGLRLELEP